MSLEIDTVFGQSADLIQVTRAVDALGTVTSVSEDTTSITCSIQPLNYKERQLLGDGISSVGAIKVYLKCSYESETVIPAIGNIIVYDSVRYRVETLNEWSVGSSVMYYKAICQRL